MEINTKVSNGTIDYDEFSDNFYKNYVGFENEFPKEEKKYISKLFFVLSHFDEDLSFKSSFLYSMRDVDNAVSDLLRNVDNPYRHLKREEINIIHDDTSNILAETDDYVAVAEYKENLDIYIKNIVEAFNIPSKYVKNIYNDVDLYTILTDLSWISSEEGYVLKIVNYNFENDKFYDLNDMLQEICLYWENGKFTVLKVENN